MKRDCSRIRDLVSHYDGGRVSESLRGGLGKLGQRWWSHLSKRGELTGVLIRFLFGKGFITTLTSVSPRGKPNTTTEHYAIVGYMHVLTPLVRCRKWLFSYLEVCGAPWERPGQLSLVRVYTRVTRRAHLIRRTALNPALHSSHSFHRIRSLHPSLSPPWTARS
jgi:hypothetical protein